jgi:hypothetical protein
MFPVIVCYVEHIIHVHLDFDDAALFVILEHVFRAPLRDMMIDTPKITGGAPHCQYCL